MSWKAAALYIILLMKHQPSQDDLELQRLFEAGIFPPSEFSHGRHIQLAYVYLCQYEQELAFVCMRQSIQNYLKLHGIDISKYHETLTRAWMLAVRHFMENAEPASSAEQFIQDYPMLLDKDIMLTHYSPDRLFSEQARTVFTEPDVEQIPRYI